ncbi:MAG: bifunctional hydroxymethylpyrimidine kinase/phosphomethylpyrimidine kinase [Synergistaceae bacterium]|nr:bifunctional hydroxymethylpyrimidine kinase/phosphomethylpyrimidine kinase [Synergistaceae bacterium]
MSIYRGVALTVAGSDSGGGAGVQADLKTFAALRVFGTTVLTALTAQNSLGVSAIQDIPREMIRAQLDAVCGDFKLNAVKTGMLGSREAVLEVAGCLAGRCPFLIVDPVMVATSGDPLLEPEAERTLAEILVPKADLVTPNVPEAEKLTGRAIRDVEGMIEAAFCIARTGARGVLVKGGHMEGTVLRDVLLWEGRVQVFEEPRIPTEDTHGTGCTLSAAITAELAAGCGMEDAVRRARTYLRSALASSFRGGKGRGCLGHAVSVPWIRP